LVDGPDRPYDPRMTRFDAIIVGGGLVGAAIAYGLQREGIACALIDEGDVAFRASRGNFGLLWVASTARATRPWRRPRTM
jgi:glycine/D-amino acid oxidase-like deaminating enzyme